MENVFFWAQVIGFFAMAIGVAAMQIKDSRKILLWNAPSSLLWTIQYLMLGAPIGALLNLGSALKDTGTAFLNQRYVSHIIMTYMAMSWGVGLYNFAHWCDALPLIGVTIVNSALMIDRDNRSLFVRAVIVNCAVWVVYNTIVGSWMGAACASLVIVSSVISMARYEEWKIGRCYRSFVPSITRALFTFSNFRTFP